MPAGEESNLGSFVFTSQASLTLGQTGSNGKQFLSHLAASCRKFVCFHLHGRWQWRKDSGEDRGSGEGTDNAEKMTNVVPATGTGVIATKPDADGNMDIPARIESTSDCEHRAHRLLINLPSTLPD